MKYYKKITLKDGRECILRSCTEHDGKAVLDTMRLTLAQTDYLIAYPEESNMTPEAEALLLRKKADSMNEAEIVAVVEGVITGLASVNAVGPVFKVHHRGEVGISLDKKYWSLGIGSALINSCIECARKAGYTQLELNVVANNERAVTMYQKAGFIEYGRNPRGFRSKFAGYQELICMRMEL